MEASLRSTIYLGIGTNLGDRRANLEQSISRIGEEVGSVLCESMIYQTKAWGVENQPDFLNQVIKVSTQLSPEKTLQVILKIETDMGRIRTRKWYTRLIDIDLLFYDETIIETPTLIVPHPYIQDRNFVLAPLVGIAPDLMHPILQKTMQVLWEECSDALMSKRLSKSGDFDDLLLVFIEQIYILFLGSSA